MSVWISKGEEQKEVELRLYAPKSEVIELTFNPLKLSEEPDWNPQWEEWHAYATPLVIYMQDYTILLKDYFAKMYPTKDAFDGTPEPCFDVCFYNWLETDDWQKEALRHTTIIVVEGNQ